MAGPLAGGGGEQLRRFRRLADLTAVVTFLLIVVGYGSGFWKLSSGAEQVQPSPSPAAIVIEHRAG